MRSEGVRRDFQQTSSTVILPQNGCESSMQARMKQISRMLRKNMTPEEKQLWYQVLKPLPVTFKRQKVFGNYIVDFYCASKNTVIEIDGSQHFEKIGKAEDEVRDKYLNRLGLKVLRYSNYEINTAFDSVCEDILKHFEML